MSDRLDKPGDWKIKVTVYRNGRIEGFTDTEGWETYDQAAYWVGEALTTRELQGRRAPVTPSVPTTEERP